VWDRCCRRFVVMADGAHAKGMCRLHVRAPMGHALARLRSHAHRTREWDTDGPQWLGLRSRHLPIVGLSHPERWGRPFFIFHPLAGTGDYRRAAGIIDAHVRPL